MKKVISFAMTAIFMLCLSGCGKKEAQTVNTYEGFRTYYEMSDSTWQCDGQTYKYRLVIKGRMSNAAADSTFVYLSNTEDISFDRAWKAAGFSSDSNDYFPKEEAVFVGFAE